MQLKVRQQRLGHSDLRLTLGIYTQQARAQAVTPLVEAGKVFLPESMPLVEELIDEMASFPAGRHGDIVDSVSQVLNYFRKMPAVSAMEIAEVFCARHRSAAVDSEALWERALRGYPLTEEEIERCSTNREPVRIFPVSKDWSCLNWRTWSVSSPLYCFFQRYRVCSVIPTWRINSATGTPISACFSTATICSTENRFLFTAKALLRLQILPETNSLRMSEKGEPLSAAQVVEAGLTRIQRFHGSVSLDPTRFGRDAGKIADEVVQHLTGLVGAKVEVTLEISGEVPQGLARAPPPQPNGSSSAIDSSS